MLWKDDGDLVKRSVLYEVDSVRGRGGLRLIGWKGYEGVKAE